MKDFTSIALNKIHPRLRGTLIVGGGGWTWIFWDEHGGHMRSSKPRKAIAQRPLNLHPRSPKHF